MSDLQVVTARDMFRLLAELPAEEARRFLAEVPRPIRGGARDHAISLLEGSRAAAAAGTTNFMVPIPASDEHLAFLAEGFYWLYETTEANADNTLDFDMSYSAGNDGTFDTVVFTNTNANGLGETGAAAVTFTNRRNAASGGAAAAAAANPANVRIPAGTTLRIQIVTAGTGTIPTVRLGVYGKWV